MYPDSLIEQLKQNLGDSPKHINNKNNMEMCRASSFVRNVDKYISIVTTHWNIKYEGYYIFKNKSDSYFQNEWWSLLYQQGEKGIRCFV